MNIPEFIPCTRLFPNWPLASDYLNIYFDANRVRYSVTLCCISQVYNALPVIKVPDQVTWSFHTRDALAQRQQILADVLYPVVSRITSDFIHRPSCSEIHQGILNETLMMMDAELEIARKVTLTDLAKHVFGVIAIDYKLGRL